VNKILVVEINKFFIDLSLFILQEENNGKITGKIALMTSSFVQKFISGKNTG
jgi:hypothetical protein